jgi:tetratricopeptide (TPR) repeat protein
MEDSMTGAIIRRSVAIAALAVGLVCVALPASAQTGQVKGKVVDAQGNPVDGAKIQIQSVDKGGKPLETKSNKKGEYLQVGLPPGPYKITATKGDMSQTLDAHVGLDMATVDFKLGAGGRGEGMSKEEVAKAKAKNAALNQAFSDGVQLTNDGKTEEAIAKFQEVIAAAPTCAECYSNIGTVEARAGAAMQDGDARQKKWGEAEEAFKKAIELNPKLPDPYSGLANLYNAEKKFDQAAEMSKKAMDLTAAAPAAGGAAGAPSGASASATYNQGIILWNAGKIPEAKTQFEQAVKLDPNFADAHYWLGMAMINAGNTDEAKPHFETYLKLAPTGQYAATAKSILGIK